VLESKRETIQIPHSGSDMAKKDKPAQMLQEEKPMAKKKSKEITAKEMFNRIIVVAELLSKSDAAQN
jgi:hypothetical protein